MNDQTTPDEPPKLWKCTFCGKEETLEHQCDDLCWKCWDKEYMEEDETRWI